ncbi:MAG: hypothetical protein ACXW4E_05265 [Anaerolineales bacterium]
MKSRTQFSIAVGFLLLTLGFIWFILSGQTREPAQVYPATINRDCAPWDGTAFTMSFRYDPITTITISIWQSPRFAFPVTFSFPDETMRVGTAYSVQELDPLEELNGKVTFWRVEEGIPSEGEFSFTTERGKRFSGRFSAEWGNQIVYCG